MSHIQESEKIYHSCLNKNKDGNNNCLKKATDVVHRQIHLFGNGRGTLQAVLEHTLKKKNKKKKWILKNLIDTFQSLWNIQRWLEASDSEVEILNEPYEFYVVETHKYFRKDRNRLI